MSCPKIVTPVNSENCNIVVAKNWKWVFPNKTLFVTFDQPISNQYGLGGRPVVSRAVCNFSVYDSGKNPTTSISIPPCDINKGRSVGFFTKNGNLYIDSYTNLYCAYQIGRNSDGSYLMRSQDGSTISSLYPI